jgi:hypothetical protein
MLLKLLRTIDFDCLMLFGVSDQEHFVLRLKTCKQGMKFLRAGERAFVPNEKPGVFFGCFLSLA